MLKLLAWDVTLTLRGPVLTTSSAPQEFGIDAPFARNAAGEYYLAGTLVKGKLKEAWKELEEVGPDELCKWNWMSWLGKEPSKDEDWTSERGLVQFTDFLYAGADAREIEKKTAILYRVEKDDVTEAVASGQNQMISTPFLSNGLYQFKGRIWSIMSDAEATDLESSLNHGLKWVSSIGADHTVGFGVVADIKVTRLAETDYERTIGKVDAPDADVWGIALKPEGPLVIVGKRIADNIFESQQEIPGGVLKGALADAILRIYGSSERDVAALAQHTACEMLDLCREFSKIRVLFAKPVEEGQRQRWGPIPASVVTIGKENKLVDVAIKDIPSNEQGTAFQIDWKSQECEDAEKQFKIVKVPYELRVRTQIDSVARSAADANLFAYRMAAPRALVPEKKGNAIEIKLKSYEWLTLISFDRITDAEVKKRVKEQLGNLITKYGIPGVGKLKTYCTAKRVQVEPHAANLQVDKEQELHRWVITLQTPALLCNVDAIQSGFSKAHDAYDSYWADLSDHNLTLERHFARQHLAGGEYQWKRFSAKTSYRPFVLTDAGAVFVLRSDDKSDLDVIEKKIADWLLHGLPVAKSVCKELGLSGNHTDWSKCPYIPENGYGEIAVDLKWHWKEAQS
jgi:hypothetical protein